MKDLQNSQILGDSLKNPAIKKEAVGIFKKDSETIHTKDSKELKGVQKEKEEQEEEIEIKEKSLEKE